MDRRRFHHRRPPHWWPENETWPPIHPSFARHRRRPFLFPLGCLFPILFLIAGFGCAIFSLISILRPDLMASANPWGLLAAGAVLVSALLFLLIRILRRSVEPLGDMMEAADRVASGDYATRLEEQGSHEMRGFTRSFNTMTHRLQTYDEQRKRMLADISHELRTPLTVLQGNLEGMLDNVYARDDERLNILLEETRILSRLIDDLRTFSLAETGKLTLQKEPCDPARLANDLADAMKSQAAKADVGLTVDMEPDLPAVDMDPARIREVFENLISNAIRHTPAGGGIRIGCRRAAGKDSQLEFSVVDNGRGIPAEDLPFIFDRYYKSRDSGGTGLGLAIAKRLVEAHGGTIRAESRPGEGTTIRFWLPMK